MDILVTRDPAELQSALAIVCAALASLDLRAYESPICAETDLLDLGVDSLRFVDLTVRLEDAFDLSELPMQKWVDHMLEVEEPLTVGALAQACLEAQASERGSNAK